MEEMLVTLLTKYREVPENKQPGVTEVFLAALGTHGTQGFQCELGFGDTTTRSFQGATLEWAVSKAYVWAHQNYRQI